MRAFFSSISPENFREVFFPLASWPGFCSICRGGSVHFFFFANELSPVCAVISNAPFVGGVYSVSVCEVVARFGYASASDSAAFSSAVFFLKKARDFMPWGSGPPFLFFSARLAL